jgi:hypothetical protein
VEQQRVLAVTGPGGGGSGYLIASRLVLTSAHVATGVDRALTVFRPGHAGTYTATLVWCGAAGGRDDAALVLVTDAAWSPPPGRAVVWGRTVTDQPGIPGQAWGRPAFAQREGRATDLIQVSGTVNPGSGLVADRYVLELDSFPPAGDSPWAGMSGAALFCGDLLAGVVAVDPADRQHAALHVVPAYVLLRDPAFVAVLAVHAGAVSVGCEAIELQPITDATVRVVAGEPVGSPAALLTARHAVVPFHGREDLLAELHAWAGRPGLGVWLLHGPGGQGKTRLAREFADRLGREGWAGVWLAAAADAGGVRVLAAVSRSTVVVVDYAESRAAQLMAVFRVLAGVAPGVSVKVVLLARTAGAWWEELAAGGGEVVRDIAELAVLRVLPVLDEGEAARSEAYWAAVSAFAVALGAAPGVSGRSWAAVAASLSAARSVVSLSRLGAGSTVLAVQMTALADLLDSVSGPDGPDGPESVGVGAVGRDGVRGPEDRVLDHERGYWLSTATARGLMPGLSLATLTDVVVAAAVLGPVGVDAVGGVVARVPGVADQPADRRDAVRGWLTAVYPPGGEGVFEGLVPDRLAERLVGRSILDGVRPCVVEWLASQADGVEAVRLLTVCVRAAAHAVWGSGVGERVTRWCVRYAGVLVVAAVEVAILLCGEEACGVAAGPTVSGCRSGPPDPWCVGEIPPVVRGPEDMEAVAAGGRGGTSWVTSAVARFDVTVRCRRPYEAVSTLTVTCA